MFCKAESSLKNYLFDIGVPWIQIEIIELVFEKFRMALSQYKYDIKVRNDDAIKRNRIQFDFM